MKSKRKVLVMTVFAIAALFPTTPFSADTNSLASQWRLTPETSRNHPRYKTLVLLAREKMTLATCTVHYGHSRGQFVTGSGEGGHKGVKGGTIQVSLEVMNRTGSRQLDRRALKKNKGVLGWVDSSGREDGDRAYIKTKDFPLELKKGDALLVSMEFTGMPEILGVEKGGGKIRYDTVSVYGECYFCGSNDFPCP